MNKDLRGISFQQVQHFCPSYYAESPKFDVSDKYTFISTREISEMLLDMGFILTYARESRSVDPTNRGLTRHMVKWSHPDFIIGGADRIELVGINAHNRASLFKFMAGVFRRVCSNGLISQTSQFGSFSIRHIGDIESEVKEAVANISKFAATLSENIETMKDIELSDLDQDEFAEEAHSIIYKDPDTAPIKPLQLLKPRRGNDSEGGSFYSFGSYSRPKHDLWTTFNTIQENILKGGLRGFNTAGKRTKTRRINSIDKDVKLNTSLWELAEKQCDKAA